MRTLLGYVAVLLVGVLLGVWWERRRVRRLLRQRLPLELENRMRKLGGRRVI